MIRAVIALGCFALTQGLPPGLQFNPFFDAQNPPPGLQFNPLFNGEVSKPDKTNFIPSFKIPPEIPSNPFATYWINWKKKFLGGGHEIAKRAAGYPPYFPPYVSQFNPFFSGQIPNVAPNRTNFIPTFQVNASNPYKTYWMSQKPFFAGRSHGIAKRSAGYPPFFQPPGPQSKPPFQVTDPNPYKTYWMNKKPFFAGRHEIAKRAVGYPPFFQTPGPQFGPSFQYGGYSPFFQTPGPQFRPSSQSGSYPSFFQPPGPQFRPSSQSAGYPQYSSPYASQFNPFFSGQIPSFAPNRTNFATPFQVNAPFQMNASNPYKTYWMSQKPFFAGRSHGIAKRSAGYPPFFQPPGPQFKPPFQANDPNPYKTYWMSKKPFFAGRHGISKRAAGYPPFFQPPGPQFKPPFSTNDPNPYKTYWMSKKPFFAGRHGIAKRAVGYPPYYPTYACIQNYPKCSGGHHLFAGCRSSTDRLLFSQCFEKPGRFYSRRSKIIRYPPPGFIQNNTITAIAIEDQNCEGKGGHARIANGHGIGQRNTTIELYSTEIGRGFHFCVQVYGR